jgi:hypothetical protein
MSYLGVSTSESPIVEKNSEEKCIGEGDRDASSDFWFALGLGGDLTGDGDGDGGGCTFGLEISVKGGGAGSA